MVRPVRKRIAIFLTVPPSGDAERGRSFRTLGRKGAAVEVCEEVPKEYPSCWGSFVISCRWRRGPSAPAGGRVFRVLSDEKRRPAVSAGRLANFPMTLRSSVSNEGLRPPAERLDRTECRSRGKAQECSSGNILMCAVLCLTASQSNRRRRGSVFRRARGLSQRGGQLLHAKHYRRRNDRRMFPYS